MYTIAVTILLYFYFYFLYIKNFKIDYLKNNVLLVRSPWLSALHVMQCKYLGTTVDQAGQCKT